MGSLNTANLWHARLGHIYTKTTKNSKNGLWDTLF